MLGAHVHSPVLGGVLKVRGLEQNPLTSAKG